MSKRILVTGANGFIGRRTIQPLLERGFEVHALCWPKEDCAKNRFPSEVEIHTVDLLASNGAAEILSKVKASHLLHLAWYTAHGKFWTSPANLEWVRASLLLYQQFRQSGGRRAIIAGSCAEYEWGAAARLKEDSPCRPGSLYGTTKNALHEMLAFEARQTDTELAWGRVFFIYGPDDNPDKLITGLLKNTIEGTPGSCRFGTLVRDHIYVEDAGAAFAAIADSPVCGPVNIGSGIPMSLADITRTIAETTRSEDLITVENNTPPADQPESIVADISLLQNSIGFSPKYDLQSGIEATYRSMRDDLQNR
jgi:nucleoside-diphosphate-sugar epimerase